MKRGIYGLILIGVLLLGVGAYLWWENLHASSTAVVSEVVKQESAKQEIGKSDAGIVQRGNGTRAEQWVLPLDRAGERVVKKPFGIWIDPGTSPVQPERFRGYHTGADFETFPEEADAEVSVRAVCTGTVIEKRRVSGYGGALIEQCLLEGDPIIVLYGHLELASITHDVGDTLYARDAIGLLGAGYSYDTDGERKHLHLSFHRGSSIDYRGYVQNKLELSGWIDPCGWVCE